VGHAFNVEQVVIDNKQDKNETNNQKRNENDLFPGYEHQIKNQFHAFQSYVSPALPLLLASSTFKGVLQRMAGAEVDDRTQVVPGASEEAVGQVRLVGFTLDHYTSPSLATSC
jgi:hypothetical protein